MPRTTIAFRLVTMLKQEIPGLTGQASHTGLKKMERWLDKAKLFRMAIEKHGLISGKAQEWLKMAESSMKVQIVSYRRLLRKEIKEKELEVKLYEAEVNMNGCLHLLQLKQNPEEENPFFD